MSFISEYFICIIKNYYYLFPNFMEKNLVSILSTLINEETLVSIIKKMKFCLSQAHSDIIVRYSAIHLLIESDA